MLDRGDSSNLHLHHWPRLATLGNEESVAVSCLEFPIHNQLDESGLARLEVKQAQEIVCLFQMRLPFHRMARVGLIGHWLGYTRSTDLQYCRQSLAASRVRRSAFIRIC